MRQIHSELVSRSQIVVIITILLKQLLMVQTTNAFGVFSYLPEGITFWQNFASQSDFLLNGTQFSLQIISYFDGGDPNVAGLYSMTVSMVWVAYLFGSNSL